MSIKHLLFLCVSYASACTALGQESFVRVSSTDQLIPDAEYILVCDYDKSFDPRVATYSKKTNNLGKASFTLNNGRVEIPEDNDKVVRFTIRYTALSPSEHGYQLITKEGKALTSGSSVLGSTTNSTSLFTYEEGMLKRTTGKTQIVYDVATSTFIASSANKYPTCLYVKEGSPFAFTTQEGGNSIILYSTTHQRALAKEVAATTNSVALALQHGTAYCGVRKDIARLSIEQGEGGVFLRNTLGTYLSAQAGKLLFTPKGDATLWNLKQEDGRTLLLNATTQETLCCTDEENFSLQSSYPPSQAVTVLYQTDVQGMKMESAGYSTYYNEAPYIMPTGLKGTSVQATENGSGQFTLQTPYEYLAGSIVPAQMPLVLKSDQTGESAVGLHLLLPSLEAGVLPVGKNYLKGLTHSGMIPQEATQHFYYKLTYSNDMQHFGFYWGAEGGVPFEMKGNRRAYLSLPISIASAAPAFTLNGEGITGLNQLVQPASTLPSIRYDLAGRRINHYQRGVYIINRQKILVR